MTEDLEKLQEETFPLDASKYAAFGKITANMLVNNEVIETFNFHILIANADKNNNYYCLNIENDDIVYSSNLEVAFKRIKDRTELMITFALEENDLSNIFEYADNQKYLKIYDEIKRKYQQEKKINLVKAKAIEELLADKAEIKYHKVESIELKPNLSKKTSLPTVKFETHLAKIIFAPNFIS